MENRQLRLAFVAHSFPPPNQELSQVGGMQRVACDLLKSLQEDSSVQIIPIVLSAPRWVRFLGGVPFFYISSFFKLLFLCFFKKIDGILFSSIVTGCMAPFLRALCGKHAVPMVAIAHGRDVIYKYFPYSFFVKKALRSLDGVASISRATAQEVIDRGLPQEKSFIIPNGIDFSRFSEVLPSDAREDLFRQSPGLPDLPQGAFLMIAIGRQVKRKGHAWFIRHVMPLLPPHIHFWLGGDGPESENIRRTIKACGLDRRVHALGALSEGQVQALYRGADLFVMPNISVPGDCEGFGVVILEAGFFGLPVIAAKLEGIIDVIQEGTNGFFARGEIPQDYVEIILKLSSDPSLCKAFSDMASCHVKETYGWPEIARKHLLVFRSLRKNYS